MDGIIITAAVILTVICLIEIVQFFLSAPETGAPAYIAVVPVFEDDDELSERLEYLALKTYGRRRVVIVNYSATVEQTAMCRNFVRNSPDSVFIEADKLESTLLDILTSKHR